MLPQTTTSSKSHTPALILSSALPPIPGKIVEKIRTGAYVDLKDMLSDNMALKKRLDEVGAMNHLQLSSKYREIQDPLSWVYCFLSFIVAKVDDPLSRQLIAYTQLVLDLARRHGGKGWLSYDCLFREHMAAGSKDKWEELNPSLMASTVLGSSDTQHRFCSACMSSDHNKQECSFSSMDPNVSRTNALNTGPSLNRSNSPLLARPSFRAKPYNVPTRPRNDICRRFNRGTCYSSACKYDHICNSCQRPGHSAIECKVKPDTPIKAGTAELPTNK